jgi:hypothetical protein
MMRHLKEREDFIKELHDVCSLLSDEIMKDEMGGTCRTHGRNYVTEI